MTTNTTNEWVNLEDARADLATAQHDFMVYANLYKVLPSATNGYHMDNQARRLREASDELDLRLAQYNTLLIT